MVKRKPTPELDKLFKRTRAVTKQPGSLKKLARYLGALPQTLSDWLGGRFEPGGEVTLKLQKRVERLERQPTKDPAGALTPTGQMTRSAKSNTNEKVQPDRPKG